MLGYEKFEPYLLDVQDSATLFPAILIPEKRKVRNPERIFVQAPVENTKRIIIGNASVKADLSEGASVIIEPGSSAMLPMREEVDLYAIAEVSGQKLLVTYLQGQDERR
jgi:hypothetical protein